MGDRCRPTHLGTRRPFEFARATLVIKNRNSCVPGVVGFGIAADSVSSTIGRSIRKRVERSNIGTFGDFSSRGTSRQHGIRVLMMWRCLLIIGLGREKTDCLI